MLWIESTRQLIGRFAPVDAVRRRVSPGAGLINPVGVAVFAWRDVGALR